MSARRGAPGVLLLACALGAPLHAHAGGCSVASSGLAFGSYQPLTFAGKMNAGAVTSDASVRVACTGIVTGGAYTIALGPSLAGTGDRIGTRYLANTAGGPDMAFNVYLDPARSTVWGDGISAGALLNGSIPPGDSDIAHTVYGRIPAGQGTLRTGDYSGALTMTISFTP